MYPITCLFPYISQNFPRTHICKILPHISSAKNFRIFFSARFLLNNFLHTFSSTSFLTVYHTFSTPFAQLFSVRYLCIFFPTLPQHNFFYFPSVHFPRNFLHTFPSLSCTLFHIIFQHSFTIFSPTFGYRFST